MTRVQRLLPAAFLAAATAAAGAAAAAEPPMNQFNSAFYVCSGPEGGAFNMAYDARRPKAAKLQSSDQQTYALKRDRDADGGVVFKGDGVTFWTDGKTAKAEGGKQPFQDCKIKS